jgi:hypothetical protein
MFLVEVTLRSPEVPDPFRVGMFKAPLLSMVRRVVLVVPFQLQISSLGASPAPV